MKVKKFFLLILIVLIMFTVTAFAGEKKYERMIGLGLFVGEEWEHDPIWHVSSKYDWNHVILHPVYGWKFNRAEIYLEGNIGYLRFKPIKEDVFSVGITAMASYDVLRYDRWSLFTELGGGFGYWNKSPNNKLVRHSSLGLIQYGAGIKTSLGKNTCLRLGMRFTHTSAVPNGDTGANSYGLILGITKYLK